MLYIAFFRCNGKSPTDIELPFCYTGESWEGVLLGEFLDCPHNLATNRQTRMLANLSLVNCYSANFTHSQTQDILLQSAKNNLLQLSHFSLKEYPAESQVLFEHIFNVKFVQPLDDLKPNTIHDTRDYFNSLKTNIQEKIYSANSLDIELYKFASELFFARYKYVLNLRRQNSL